MYNYMEYASEGGKRRAGDGRSGRWRAVPSVAARSFGAVGGAPPVVGGVMTILIGHGIT